MDTERTQKDFVSFILAAETDKKLVQEFLSKKNVDDLYSFFQTKGFTGILKTDCNDILNAKKNGKALCEGAEPCPNKEY